MGSDTPFLPIEGEPVKNATLLRVEYSILGSAGPHLASAAEAH
ncbi:MAG: hypothetical protein QW313_01790 [Candidatus Caldarchaeum sp.]